MLKYISYLIFVTDPRFLMYWLGHSNRTFCVNQNIVKGLYQRSQDSTKGSDTLRSYGGRILAMIIIIAYYDPT